MVEQSFGGPNRIGTARGDVAGRGHGRGRGSSTSRVANPYASASSAEKIRAV
jgi:hypothetical protein